MSVCCLTPTEERAETTPRPARTRLDAAAHTTYIGSPPTILMAPRRSMRSSPTEERAESALRPAKSRRRSARPPGAGHLGKGAAGLHALLDLVHHLLLAAETPRGLLHGPVTAGADVDPSAWGCPRSGLKPTASPRRRIASSTRSRSRPNSSSRAASWSDLVELLAQSGELVAALGGSPGREVAAPKLPSSPTSLRRGSALRPRCRRQCLRLPRSLHGPPRRISSPTKTPGVPPPITATRARWTRHSLPFFSRGGDSKPRRRSPPRPPAGPAVPVARLPGQAGNRPVRHRRRPQP